MKSAVILIITLGMFSGIYAEAKVKGKKQILVEPTRIEKIKSRLPQINDKCICYCKEVLPIETPVPTPLPVPSPTPDLSRML